AGPCHVTWLQAALARPAGEADDGLRDGLHVEAPGVPNDRHHQTLRHVDRDPDVGDPGRQRESLDEERGPRPAVAADPGKIDLADTRTLRDGRPRLEHALGDA